MSPTLSNGQIIVATSLKKPRLNSIIVVKHDGLEKVKRLSKLGNNQAYILGDNPASSMDSKDFGWISNKSIIASVVWPIYQQKR